MNDDNQQSKVEFEDDQLQKNTRSLQIEKPKIIELIIKYSGGVIKNEKQGNYFLIGFVVVTIITTFILFFNGNQNKPTSSQQVQLNRIKQLQNN